ncbi:MAG: hypothetical protein ACSHXK_15165 [Oceanococcus sp.]
MSQTFLTTTELSEIIKYDARTIRERLKDTVLIEGRHYIRPFGGRKLLYIWEVIEKDLLECHATKAKITIPLASGGVCNG